MIMIVVESMVISSLYFVEHLCHVRILPLTARFASFPAPSTWPCVRPSPPHKKCQRGGWYIVSTDIDLDPFPMNRACGKCLLSRRTWCICPLPSSANNHAEWSPVWTEILAPLWKANARWFFHHQFSFGVRQSCPHSLVLQFLQAAGQALCRSPLQAR